MGSSNSLLSPAHYEEAKEEVPNLQLPVNLFQAESKPAEVFIAYDLNASDVCKDLVAKINKELTSMKFCTYLVTEAAKTDTQVVNMLEDSKCVIICCTKNYLNTINNSGGVFSSLYEAKVVSILQSRLESSVIPVVLEPGLFDSEAEWSGAVSSLLRPLQPIDCSETSLIPACLDQLSDRIVSVLTSANMTVSRISSVDSYKSGPIGVPIGTVEEFSPSRRIGSSRVKSFKGHSDYVISVVWSPNGEYIASVSDDETVRIWDSFNGNTIRTFDGAAYSSACFSPDSSLITLGALKCITIIECLTGKEVNRFTDDISDAVSSLCWRPDGSYLAQTCKDSKVAGVFSIESGSCVAKLEGHTRRVNAIAYSPCGKYISTGSGDKTIRIWDGEELHCLKILKGHMMSVCSITWSPDSQFVVSGSNDKTLRIWNNMSGECVNILTGHTACVSSVAYSINGEHICSGSLDKTIRIWNAADGKIINVLEGHTNEIHSVAWSSDGQYIASGSSDKTIGMW